MNTQNFQKQKHLLAPERTSYQYLATSLQYQQGVTLLEMMVGLVIGLLVVAVAMGALMVSRSVTGTVSDASGIQQQGSHILRLVGSQLRQAGSLYLNPNPTAVASSANDVLSAVVFEIKASAKDKGNSFDQTNTLKGGADTITTGFRRYEDNVFFSSKAGASTDFLARNCLGAPANDSTDERIESIFTFSDNNLRCAGNGSTAQPIAQNVAEFQVSYLVQTLVAGTGSNIQRVKAADMPTDAADVRWRQVQGVEVCFVLYGSELIDLKDIPKEARSYTNCDGQSKDLTELTGARKSRTHQLFRNTFQIRSQGLI
ncbi:MAG: PilW family protein [Comamonas sp.]|uniref:PilW family protein n=1 Tax=Comamonas sp. TaxID=34028 RepID=UPI002FC89F86